MININTLTCGTITISSGTPGPAGHPETRVRYTEDSGITPREQTFDIEGELTYDSIPNISDAEEVDIGNAVTSIADEAFYLCRGLTSVTIPDSVTYIGTYAFYDCRGLTSVTIPNSVTFIGGDAFYNCRGLTSVTFNSFTKNQVKSMTTSDYIFGVAFVDDDWNPMEKSFTDICTDGSMTVHFSADVPATITFTDL